LLGFWGLQDGKGWGFPEEWLFFFRLMLCLALMFALLLLLSVLSREFRLARRCEV
jgi:hypothetical protein